MNVKNNPVTERASSFKPGEICLLDNVPHLRLKDDGPVPERRNLIPFMTGTSTLEWIHADTLMQPRRKIEAHKVPVGVGFLLESGAEYVRVEFSQASFVDSDQVDRTLGTDLLLTLQRTQILAMQIRTGQIYAFGQGKLVVPVDIIAEVNA